MSVWFAHALFFCTFSVEACEFVTCEVPDFENAMRMIGSRVALSDKIDFISMMSHARSSSTSCLRMSIPSLSSYSSTSSTPQTTLPINKHRDDPQNEECGPVASTTSSTGYEPNVIDNFDYSEIYTAIFQDESGDIDTEPSYSFDAELDDELVRKALSPPLFTQERQESANLRQTYHSREESLLPAQSFFYTNKYGETRIRTKG